MTPHPDVTRFARILFEEARRSGVTRPVFEVRILKTQRDGTLSGYFDTPEKIADAIFPRDGAVEAIYITPNPTHVDCFARAANKLKPRAGATTSDAQIVQREWLLVDIDPIRPKGVSSTEVQHVASIQKAKDVRAFLEDLGFPSPLLGDSGNGAHLMYRIDLANDEDSKALIKRCLEALEHRFPDPVVKVDTTSFNAARIWKLYGTMACKGENLPEQPHRRATLLEAPTPLGVATRDILLVLASHAPAPDIAPRTAARGDFDLMTWFRANKPEGTELGEEKALDGGGWVREIRPCPWGDHELDGACFIGQRASGAIIHGCRHDRCNGKDWHDLRVLWEPDRRKNQSGGSGPPPHSDDDAPHAVRPLRLVRDESPALATGSSSPVPPTADEILRSAVFAEPQKTYATGFAALDCLLDGGFRAKALHVFAAPTGAGKTGLALTLARQMDIPTLYVTAELDSAEIASRYAAPMIGARPGEIMALRVSPERAAAAVEERPLYVLDLDGVGGDVAIAVIRAAAEAIKGVTGAYPAVFVDYLQLLAVETADAKVRMGMTRVTLELRRLARALDVPVVAISSVSRAYYGTKKGELDAEDDPRTWLAAGKEDGNIEYTSAVFMYLDTSTDIDANGASAARLIVAKSRGGIPGFVGMRFLGPLGGFVANDAAHSSFGPARRTADLRLKIFAVVREAKRGLTMKELKAKVTGAKKDTIAEVTHELIGGGDLAELDVKRKDDAGRFYPATVIVMPTDAKAGDIDD